MPRCDICGLNQQKSHHTNRLAKIVGSPRIRLHHFGQHPTSGFFLANFFGEFSGETSPSYQKSRASHRVLIGFVQDEHDHNLLTKGFGGWGDVFLQMSQKSRSLSIKLMILRDTRDSIRFYLTI